MEAYLEIGSLSYNYLGEDEVILEWGRSLIQCDWCPYRVKKRHEERCTCEDTETQRECHVQMEEETSDTATSQGTPRLVCHHQKQGQNCGTDSPSEAPEGPSDASEWTSDF